MQEKSSFPAPETSLNNKGGIDPVFSFTIDQFEYEKKILTRDSRYHLLYLKQGRVFFKKQEGFVIYYSPGFLVVPPLLGHRFRLHEQCRGYHMPLGAQLFNEISIKAVSRGLISFSDGDVTFFTLGKNEENAVNGIIADVCFEWKNQKHGFRDIIRLKLTELCINLGRIHYEAETQRNRPGSDTVDISGNEQPVIDIRTGSKKIDAILLYLKTMYSNPLSLDEIAYEMGFSTSYLSRYFKNKTGMCLFEYINKLRIKRACFLLKKTDKKIIEIAYESGYNNISFFNRYFKKTMHMSPAEYRKK